MKGVCTRDMQTCNPPPIREFIVSLLKIHLVCIYVYILTHVVAV